MTKNKFYAVQIGDNFDWDNGAETLEAAEAMAREEIADGKEIRIAVIDVDTDYCEQEIIVREGSRD